MIASMTEPDDRTAPERQRLPGMVQPAVDSLPGLARVAASAALHTTEWSVKTSAKAWLRVGRAMTSREEAAQLAKDAGEGVAVWRMGRGLQVDGVGKVLVQLVLSADGSVRLAGDRLDLAGNAKLKGSLDVVQG